MSVSAVRSWLTMTVIAAIVFGGSAAASEGVLISSIFEGQPGTRIDGNVRINDAGVIGFFTDSSADPSYSARVLRYENGGITTIGGSPQGVVAPGDIQNIHNVHLNDNGLFVVHGTRVDDVSPSGIVAETFAIWSGTQSLDLVYNAPSYNPGTTTDEVVEIGVSEVDNAGRIYGFGLQQDPPRYGFYEFGAGSEVQILPDGQFEPNGPWAGLVLGPNDSGRMCYGVFDHTVFPNTSSLMLDDIRDGAGPTTLIAPGDAFDGGTFVAFSAGSNVTNNGHFAFRATVEKAGAFAGGIYVTDGTSTSKLFDVVTPATPDAPMQSVSFLTMNDNGLVAFVAEATDPAFPGRALYATTDGTNMTRIIGEGDPLLGSFIDVLGIRRFDLNSHNRVAFSARLTDGRSVVALARLSDEIPWINASGGNWSEGENWLPGEPPIEDDTAVFDLAADYTVALDEPVEAAGVRIVRGNVTFDSGGHSMQFGSVSVGEADGQQAILRVPDLDSFNAQSIVVGAVANAESALVLGPDAANPAGANADETAHESGGTGAFLPNTALSCNSHSRVVIQNATLEFSSISTSASGPLPVPYPDIASQSDRILIKNSNVAISGDLNVGEGTHFIDSNGDAAGVATGIISARVSSDRALIWSAIFVSQSSRLTSRDFRVNSAAPSSEDPPVLLSIHTNSTLETLPGGTAVVGGQGEGAVDVSGGSTFVATGADVTVGQSGSGTLTITDQSSLAADSLTLGKDSGSAGNVAVSSVTGTSTIHAPQISVAVAGSGVLRVADGGEVVSDTLDISITEDDEPPPDDTGAGAGMLDGIGQLIVTGSGRVVADEVNIGPMGELLGDGFIEVDDGVTNSGKVKPGASPGTLTITGPYTQTETGQLEIEFAGAGDGQHDVLAVEGDVEIEGSVTLQFIDGFAPQQGQQFEIFAVGGTADLSDATFEVRNLAPGFMFDITPSAGGIMMTALNDGVFVPDTILGDFNGDGVVDAADYVVWRKSGASPEGYDEWRANFGSIAGAAASLMDASVPEPQGMTLFAISLCAISALRERQPR
jgi:hypothetical protein